MLLDKLRPRFRGRIVIGGAGLSTNGIASTQADFGQYLRERGVIDHYIRGEADHALVALLRGQNDFPGIDSDQQEQIDDIDQIPYPNYDDVIVLPYRWSTEQPQIPITSSRGCIRKCSFCDIHAVWKKYRYRSGSSVAREMVHQYQKHGVTKFWFTDSLINGNMKTFRELCRELVSYYESENKPDASFQWGGQFVVRDSRSMTAEDYKMAARAGMNGVAVGIESLSESVRDHMKKGFTNDDLDFMMDQIHTNGMNCYFLMIVGYPTETQENFQEGLDKFRSYQHYALDGTIYGVNLGTTASIDEGTPLHAAMNSDPSVHREIKGFDWINPNNPRLDFKERIRRRIMMQEVLMDLGYKIWNGDSQLLKLREAYEKISHGNYKTSIRLQVAE